MHLRPVVSLLALSAAVVACSSRDGEADGQSKAPIASGQTACTSDNLTNSNGYVIGAPRVHVIFWGFRAYGDAANEASAAHGAFDTTSAPGAGIQNTHFWRGAAQQYQDKDLAPTGLFPSIPVSAMNAPTVDLTYDDQGLSGTSCASITETDIEAEVTYVNTHAVYPNGYKNADDFVMVAVPSCGSFDNGPGKHYFDATHGWAWGYVPYHPTDPENFIKTISHETIEAATNPYSLQKFGTPYLPPVAGENGWEQPTTSCEIGDLCELQEFAVQTQSTDVNGTTLSTMQTMWSNEVQACVHSRSTTALLAGLGSNRKIYTQKVIANDAAPGDMVVRPWSLMSSPAGAAPFVGKPSVTSWGVNNVEFVALDQSGVVWKAQSNDGDASFYWDPPLPAPGALLMFDTSDTGVSIPDAASTGAGNFEVYAFAVRNLGVLPVGTPPVTPPATLLRNSFDWGQPWTGWEPIAIPAQPASHVSAASPQSATTGANAEPIQVGLAYIDQQHLLWIGTSASFSSQPAWQSFRFGFGATPVSVDLAAWNPSGWNALVLDSTGALWDCATTGDAALPLACTSLGKAGGGAFAGTPGVASLGDGRLLFAGQVDYGGSAAFLKLQVGTQSTAWSGVNSNGQQNGALIAGLDATSY